MQSTFMFAFSCKSLARQKDNSQKIVDGNAQSVGASPTENRAMLTRVTTALLVHVQTSPDYLCRIDT